MSGISIVGLGNMARALAGRALAGGNTVEIIGRDRARAKEVAAALDGAQVGTAGAVPTRARAADRAGDEGAVISVVSAFCIVTC